MIDKKPDMMLSEASELWRQFDTRVTCHLLCRVWRVAQTGDPWPLQLHQEALQVQQTAVPYIGLHGSGCGGPSGGVCGGSCQLCHVDGHTGASGIVPIPAGVTIYLRPFSNCLCLLLAVDALVHCTKLPVRWGHWDVDQPCHEKHQCSDLCQSARKHRRGQWEVHQQLRHLVWRSDAAESSEGSCRRTCSENTPEYMPSTACLSFCFSQEVRNNPVFVVTEDDLKQTSMLTESSVTSKKEKREAERRKKASGVFNPPHLTLILNTHSHRQQGIFYTGIYYLLGHQWVWDQRDIGAWLRQHIKKPGFHSKGELHYQFTHKYFSPELSGFKSSAMNSRKTQNCQAGSNESSQPAK